MPAAAAGPAAPAAAQPALPAAAAAQPALPAAAAAQPAAPAAAQPAAPAAAQPAAPAAAQPAAPAAVEPPTIDQMKKGLLVQSDVPEGYVAEGEPAPGTKMFAGKVKAPCDLLKSETTGPTVDMVYQGFTEKDGTYADMMIAAPGAATALESIKLGAALPEGCPEFVDEVGFTYKIKAFDLDSLGDASAAIDVTIHMSAGDPMRVLMAEVALGDLSAAFSMTPNDDNDEAEFREIVKTGAKKLNKIG
ncbi:hypothetical protein AB0M02_44845 [Actinoplanes sp. NPDC051861]|uniref:hypothetical protein n=1 Tax=Actinoplanes sp. NPDC051861 TaxID=3155170 RepID=UPI003428174E